MFTSLPSLLSIGSISAIARPQAVRLTSGIYAAIQRCGDVWFDALHNSNDQPLGRRLSERPLKARFRRPGRPDCQDHLILDHDLPDWSGLDALKQLAANEGACALVESVVAGDAHFERSELRTRRREMLMGGAH
jgi:CheY-like chemotaxis protein